MISYYPAHNEKKKNGKKVTSNENGDIWYFVLIQLIRLIVVLDQSW